MDDPRVDGERQPAGGGRAAPPAGPTLRELLAVASLRLAVPPGQERGLDARVRWVQPTELADPTPYLRGGELVCTVGATLTDAQWSTSFVRSLARAGAAGLCFGVGDIHDDVPPELVAACADLEVPLLVAPFGAPFSAISEYLVTRRLEAEASLRRTAEALVSRLLAGVRSHASVSTMLENAVELIGGRLELWVDRRLLAVAGADDEPASGSPVSVPVLDSGELVWSGDSQQPSPILLQQLSRVLEVALCERDVEAALRRERIGQLLLLVQERLLDPAALGQVLDESTLGHESLVVSAWPGGAAPLITAQLPDALVGEAPGVTLAVTASATGVTVAAAALTLPCGYGSAVPLAQLTQGVCEARAALELALSHGGVVGPAGLTSLEGLLEQQPAGRLEPFVDQLMAPLVESDHRLGTHHVQTLRTFLRNNGSLQRTAREHYLHVNTVRHRLAQVQHHTGRDPLVFADRVALAIALWALDRGTAPPSPTAPPTEGSDRLLGRRSRPPTRPDPAQTPDPLTES